MVTQGKPDKPCPKCGSENAKLTGNLKSKGEPVFQMGQASQYDEYRETSYEWECEHGHKFWSEKRR
jgi:hypothetical protein